MYRSAAQRYRAAKFNLLQMTAHKVRLLKTTLAAAPLCAGLAGCKMVVLNPAGYVAAQQRDLVLLATGIMLLIVVPVIAVTLFFAWKYRASNTKATYDPEFRHSTRLEVLIWGVPIVTVLVLGQRRLGHQPHARPLPSAPSGRRPAGPSRPA